MSKTDNAKTVSGVEVSFVQDGVTADVTAYDAAGNEIEMPYRVVISPYFTRATAKETIGFMRVLRDVRTRASEINRCAVRLLGGNGRLTLMSTKERRVPPKFAVEDEATQ